MTELHTRYINIAAYHFVRLDGLQERRLALRELTRRLGLKGTILLSAEGINLFLAGTREGIDALLAELRKEPEFHDLEVKESESDDQPFQRMLVKLKTEIIAFGQEGVDPVESTSPRISPQELREWLDSGKPVHLLDVRNDYEISVGTFHNAVGVGVDHFRHFPDAIQNLPEQWKKEPIVTFCTGGIRCEKGAPYLEQSGFQEVYQLDGGILKYFEECGGAHYQGDCFVFDKRVALGPDLNPSGIAQCYACQMPVSIEDQTRQEYAPPHSCPHCYESPSQRQSRQVALRTRQIAESASPLPGSIPADSFRPLSVPGKFDRHTLIDFLCGQHVHFSREEWLKIIEKGGVQFAGEPVLPDRVVRAGERYDRVERNVIEPDVSAAISVLYEDDSIVVINKPAPLPMHPCGRFERNTLESLIRKVFHPWKLRSAHRLDANTTGVVVFSKTRSIAAKLQPQFEQGTVIKKYVARVSGAVERDEFMCDAPISVSPTVAGGRKLEETGLASRTDFRRIFAFEDGTTLLEVTPRTGRTNQIRLHLHALGHAIVGDPLYLAEGRLGETQTLAIDAPPLCLHAVELTFRHPTTGEPMTFTAPLPEWGQVTEG